MVGMPRFICDAMLGSLARWLRFFGYDCTFSEAEDGEILLASRRQGRWLLTRDGELAARGQRSVHIRSRGLEDQIAEVFERLGLEPEPTLDSARCGACNGELRGLSRDQASALVPPFVARTVSRFRRCTSCGRVYWRGSHTDRILATMRRIRGLHERTGTVCR